MRMKMMICMEEQVCDEADVGSWVSSMGLQDKEREPTAVITLATKLRFVGLST